MNSPDWLDRALDAHLASQPTRIVDIPASASFQDRCRDSALAALDVLKMRQQHALMSQFPGSLVELFTVLATRASVGIDRVFRGFEIRATEPPDEISARGLARLAWQLGLSHAESAMRLRLGITKLLTAGLIPNSTVESLPVRARKSKSKFRTIETLNYEELLVRCESRYTSEQRHHLRAIMAAFTEAFESIS